MQLSRFIQRATTKIALPIILGAGCTTGKTPEELCLDDAQGITSDIHAEIFDLTADCITLQIQDATNTPVTTANSFGCIAADNGSIWMLGEDISDLSYEGSGIYTICGLNGATQVECYELSEEGTCESQITLK